MSGYGISVFPGHRVWDFSTSSPHSMGIQHFQASGYDMLVFTGLRVWDFSVSRPQDMGFQHHQFRIDGICQRLIEMTSVDAPNHPLRSGCASGSLWWEVFLSAESALPIAGFSHFLVFAHADL